MNNTSAYLITCMTNLHVGSGNTNFGVIDNLIQRDSTSEMPTINATSLKGAIRQFFDFHWKDKEDKDKRIDYIFGPDGARSKSDKSPAIGHYSFFNADLLVLPVRSNKKPFFRATSTYLVDEINHKSQLFGLNLKLPVFEGNYNEDHAPKINSGQNVKLADYKAESASEIKGDKDTTGDDLALFSHNKFKQLAKQLPVIARNKLENGISENLWYEEVVPRESRFVFYVNKTAQYQVEFDETIQSNILQIGGNASVGMGYVKIKKMTNYE